MRAVLGVSEAGEWIGKHIFRLILEREARGEIGVEINEEGGIAILSPSEIRESEARENPKGETKHER